MGIPVLTAVDGKEKTVEIAAEDVLMVRMINRRIAYFTRYGLFYHPDSLEEVVQRFLPLGFKEVDRAIYVKMPEVKWYDEDKDVIYFDEQITKKSLFSTVSKKMSSVIKTLVKAKK